MRRTDQTGSEPADQTAPELTKKIGSTDFGSFVRFSHVVINEHEKAPNLIGLQCLRSLDSKFVISNKEAYIQSLSTGEKVSFDNESISLA